MLNKRHIGDEVAYRRGALLGFTLAEIVLLVIFALLMATAALVLVKDARIKELQAADVGLIKVPEREARLVEVLRRHYREQDRPPPSADEFVRELSLIAKTKDLAQTDALDKILKAITDGATPSKAQERLRELTRTIDVAKEMSKASKEDVATTLSKITEGINKQQALQKEIDALNKQLNASQAELRDRGKSDLPPMLVIPTSNYFKLGEATLVPEFRRRINEEIVPRLAELGAKHEIQVIEIIGHTDELPIANVRSNLDLTLLKFLNGAGLESELLSGDNPGLGIARAAAVARVLISDPRLGNYRVLPFSAGQIVDTDQNISRGNRGGDVPERRRIEIRMRRLQ